MSWKRFLVICCLLAAVPLQGMAVVAQIQQPCPMEEMMTQAEMSDSHSTTPLTPKGDCCLDDEAAALSGQLCKPGQKCHAGQLSIINTVPGVTVQFGNYSPANLPDPAYTAFALSAIWRPPLTLLH